MQEWLDEAQRQTPFLSSCVRFATLFTPLSAEKKKKTVEKEE
jgi:hypothetical protein